MPFSGHQVPDTATRIWHIAATPCDQMKMAVHDGLPSDLAGIDADIESFDALVTGDDLGPSGPMLGGGYESQTRFGGLVQLPWRR